MFAHLQFFKNLEYLEIKGTFVESGGWDPHRDHELFSKNNAPGLRAVTYYHCDEYEREQGHIGGFKRADCGRNIRHQRYEGKI